MFRPSVGQALHVRAHLVSTIQSHFDDLLSYLTYYVLATTIYYGILLSALLSSMLATMYAHRLSSMLDARLDPQLTFAAFLR